MPADRTAVWAEIDRLLCQLFVARGPKNEPDEFHPRACKACLDHVHGLLEEAGRRLVAAEIKDALAARGARHPGAVVDDTLFRGRQEGRLSYEIDARGRGFGLADWGDGQ